MYRYILFDFDGTLVDTNDLIIQTLKETAIKCLDKELSGIEINSILGRNLEDQMKYLSETDFNDLMLFYREFYKANQQNMLKEFPGVREMLDSLRKLGCKTAIVSSKGRGGIEFGLKLFHMEHYFDVIISSYDIQNSKPHPEPVIKALDLLCAPPGETIIVGDSSYDILCGKNAGIKTVLVDWSILPTDELYKTRPDYIIKTPMDLIEIIS